MRMSHATHLLGVREDLGALPDLRELHRQARDREPSLGLAAVYRHLKNLIQDGEVSEVHLPDQATRVELTRKRHHHHFYCDSYHGVFDVVHQASAQTRKQILDSGSDVEGRSRRTDGHRWPWFERAREGGTMRSMHGWRLASIITSVFLMVGLLGAPGAALAQDDGYDHDHGASAKVSPAGLAAFDEVLLGARTLGTIVGRMDAPVHSGTLAAEEGSGADVWFHVLEGYAWDLKETARALVAAATDPDEAQRILVDELFPGVQAFASQAFAMREELGAEDPELDAVRSITSALDALDLEVAGLQDSISTAAAEVQEPPLRAQRGIGGPLNPKLLPSGNVLVALSFEDRVVELTPEGEVVWEHAIGFPTVAERLEDGNTLIASLVESRVVEIDAAGAEVWSYASADIYGVDELPNGNRLITIQADPARIVELDAVGVELWSYGGGAPSLRFPSATRLENGNTLIADNSGPDGAATVTEVTPEGEVVWSYDEGLWRIYGVARLPDGDTLINDQGNGRLIQVAPDGTVTWRYGGIYLPGGFDFGPDGRFVIAVFGENRMFEIDRAVE